MKIMSRRFNRSESVLLVILGLILLGLVYYWFVDQPVRQALNAAQTESDELWNEIQTLEVDIARYEKMKEELKDIGAVSYMPSYNNSKEEFRLLNDILADTIEYSINFNEVTRNGDQIRRSFTLSFVTTDYSIAQQIIERLENGNYRCVVGDLSCKVNKDSMVSVSASATFFETMVGGVPDAGLPADSSQGNG